MPTGAQQLGGLIVASLLALYVLLRLAG